MREITVKLYQFDELTDHAKEKARDWYREGGYDYEWWESVYEDAKTIGLEITEFDQYYYAKGRFTTYAEDVAGLILKEHGKTCETYKTAAAYLKARATLSKNRSMDQELEDLLAEKDKEFLYALLQDYGTMLRKEIVYLESDESVDENIRANEYEFTEDGKREAVENRKQFHARRKAEREAQNATLRNVQD
ncbi:MAG: hypothetical protein AB7V39_00605 [Nitrospiraceae bacterium]